MNFKFSNLRLISQRLNRTGTTGREAIINLLSVLGIAFGVIALIVILSVMNGFQSGYINTIMEVSSGHIRLTGNYDDLKRAKVFLFLRNRKHLCKVHMTGSLEHWCVRLKRKIF